MAEKFSSKPKEGGGEKLWRFGRNFNLFVGGVALAGAAIAPPLAAGALGAYAGLNLVQAGGFEAGRRWSKKKRRKNGGS